MVNDLAGAARAKQIEKGVGDNSQGNQMIMRVQYLNFNKNLTFTRLLSLRERLRVSLNSVGFRGALFSLLLKSRSIF